MADDLTKEQRRKNMQHIKSSDTEIEVLLEKHYGEKDIIIEKIIKIYQESQTLH